MQEYRLGEFEEVMMLLVGILHEEAYTLKIEEEYTRQTQRSSSVGAVHASLNRLEKKGFLKSKMGAPTAKRGGRRKRIYAVTALGDRVLNDARHLRLSLWNQYPGFSRNQLGYA